MNSEKSKKDKVLGKRGDTSKRKKIVWVGAIGAVLLVGAVVLVVLLPTGNSKTAGLPATGIRQSGSEIFFSSNMFDDGKAKYFKHESSAGTVSYFLVKAKDGVIRAAFDACDVCYRAKRGYRQSGDLMFCNNCGQAFPTDRINIEKGGCNPAPLMREMKGNEVAIRFADIEKGIRYF